jgi:hypothetical protein
MVYESAILHETAIWYSPRSRSYLRPEGKRNCPDTLLSEKIAGFVPKKYKLFGDADRVSHYFFLFRENERGSMTVKNGIY